MNVERATTDDIPELVELRPAYLTEDGGLLGLSVVELKAADDGRPLYLKTGFVDDASKYHNMKWTNL